MVSVGAVDRPVTIYALIDPRDGQTRYVGKTVRPLGLRFSEHKALRRGERHMPRARWIRKLKALNLDPKLEVLEVVAPNGDWIERECFWIAHYRDLLGRRLLNISSGGDGLSVPHTAEWNEKIALAQRGVKRKPLSPEHRALVVAALRRVKHVVTDEQKAKLRAANLGKKNGPPTVETRAKISAAQKGKPRKPLTPEQEVRWRAAQVRGEGHPGAKLTSDDVSAIRSDNRKQREIAADFGITRALVGMVKRRCVWAHVP